MKLQNLILIFLAIAIPIILVLSVYLGFQIETSMTRNKYSDALINAAHEAIVAFQINTQNDEHSNVTDVKIRDIQAALNMFSSSLTTSFGQTGANKGIAMAYIPACVFTLYDGYYIYSPTERNWYVETEINDADVTVIKDGGEHNWEEVSTRHELKAYVHYVKEYENASKSQMLTVNFTLDNFVSAYYYDKTHGKYESRAGYLEIDPGSESGRNDEIIKKGGTPGDGKEVDKYYKEAWAFTKWFNEKIDAIGTPEVKELQIKKDGIKENSALPEVASDFNSAKYDVIKDSLTKNLIQSMNIFGYEMPELKGEDWDLILNNVCFIAFMQGIPIGTTRYNDYTIAVSTENRETVKGTDQFFMGDGAGADGRYHRIWCPHLTGENFIGYYKTRFKYNYDIENYEEIPEDDPVKRLACYYCVVNSSPAEFEYTETFLEEHPEFTAASYQLDKRRKAYYTALIKEKLALVNYKQTGFISNSKPVQGRRLVRTKKLENFNIFKFFCLFLFLHIWLYYNQIQK